MPKKYVIVGNGIAGASAAEELGKLDEEAEIKVFTDEPNPLYNRIMLKTYMKGRLPKQYTRVHDSNWYEKRDIQLSLNTRISTVNSETKKVETEKGEKHDYDKVLVATGGRPRKLPQDEGYSNLHYMWTMEDADQIKKSAENSEKAVVVGGGLLGIDFAVAYAENDVETHYLIRGKNWWSRGLDREGASIIHEQLEKKGVNVVTESEVESLNSSEGEVKSVETINGEVFSCDALAVAIGQIPNSELVNVGKNRKNMIKTDEHLETSEKDIFAAGNMVEYRHPIFGDKTVNGAWDHSEQMGKTAAKNMVGEEKVFDYVNTYGVGHFSSQFLAIGDWSGEPISKSYGDQHYRRLFFDNDRLVGAVMIGFTKGQEELREMIKNRVTVEDKEKLLEKSYYN